MYSIWWRRNDLLLIMDYKQLEIKAIAELDQITTSPDLDTEQIHRQADEVLCNTLRRMGFDALIEQYYTIYKYCYKIFRYI